MIENSESQATLLARLTISALEKAIRGPYAWSNPSVHKALIVGGLNVLLASTELLASDLEKDH